MKPEANLMVFLRMRSNQITKQDEKALQMQLEDIISRVCMLFGMRNPNLRSIFKPEVELMVLRCMPSNKSRKTAKNVPKMQF